MFGVALPGDGHWLIPEPAALPAACTGVSSDGEVTALPPVPDSGMLALSGLLSLGVVQLGRNVRKIHLSALPEWYHAGGPTQVGHATPLDLELGFSLAAMPVCQFDAPASPQNVQLSPVWYLRAEPDDQRHTQFFLTTADPRGPPTHS
jgi:hypothetical protein